MSAQLHLAYYGDDLTGSTDVMEALELHGVSTVLFTAIPNAAQRARFSTVRAVGVAGTSRSQSPDWMDENLPPVFTWLRGEGAAVTHYKICSTFDSSPQVGSIGRALDLGASVFGQRATPLVVGAPELRRVTAFGELFAGFRERYYRIDRHPVMSRHPVTPMDEADLALHLARQTDKSIGLVDFIALKSPQAERATSEAMALHDVVLFDVLDAQTQGVVGATLWRLRHECPFVVGSSGVEYALVSPLAATPISGALRTFSPPGARGPVAAVSGSVSPTTERQIRYALEHGFAEVALNIEALAGEGAAAEIERGFEAGSRILADGRSVLLHTALGPDSAYKGGVPLDGNRVGALLGRLLARLVERHGLRRACVSGGDTSSHAIRELGLFALRCLYPLPACPGSPLCTAFSDDPAIEGLEIAFKGGQVGTDAYFCLVRDG